MSFVKVRERLYSKAEKEVKRYTRQAFAEVIGVSYPTYMKLEKNPELLTYDQAKRLSKYLDIPVQDIFLARKVK